MTPPLPRLLSSLRHFSRCCTATRRLTLLDRVTHVCRERLARAASSHWIRGDCVTSSDRRGESLSPNRSPFDALAWRHFLPRTDQMKVGIGCSTGAIHRHHLYHQRSHRLLPHHHLYLISPALFSVRNPRLSRLIIRLALWWTDTPETGMYSSCRYSIVLAIPAPRFLAGGDHIRARGAPYSACYNPRLA